MPNLSLQDAYNELSYYTLSHPDPQFIHQLIVDTFAAQTANVDTKAIKLAFALVGLYLVIEKGYTGKQVQLVHVQLAKQRKQWPKFELPKDRGDITAFDVLGVSEGESRDRMILAWCNSVWVAYKESQQQVRDLIKTELGV